MRKGAHKKRLLPWLRRMLKRPDMASRLKKVERAAELEIIDKKQATIDKDLALGVQALLTAASNTPNAVFNIGSILVLKLTTPDQGEIIITSSLTQEQMKALNANPLILTQPHNILKSLSMCSTRTALDERALDKFN